MLITKTPFRVSLFGGSTDYESFYEKYGSLLVGFTIDKYCYLSVRQTPSIFPYKSLISYSKTEKVEDNKDIEHPGVRGTLEYLNINYGVELSHLSDLPSQTGIGSSSSFIVGLLNALTSIEGIKFSKRDLAISAIDIERNLLKEPGGIQDQIWAAYGGLNSIHIDEDGRFTVRPLPVCEDFVQAFIERSVLIYTGKARKSFKIAASHNNSKNLDTKKKILEIANDGYAAFYAHDIDKVGELLDKSWQLKRQISTLISTKTLDKQYEELKQYLIGGKLLGTGESGFLFGILKKGLDKSAISATMVPFSIDFLGSQILNR